MPDAPFRQSVAPAQRSSQQRKPRRARLPRNRRSAPHPLQPRPGGSDIRPTSRQGCRATPRTLPDGDRKTALRAPGPAFRAPRSCRSQASRAHRRNRAASSPRAARRAAAAPSRRPATASREMTCRRACRFRPRRSASSPVRYLPRTSNPFRAHAAPRGCPKTGSMHRSRSAGSAAVSPRPQSPDCSRGRESRPLARGSPGTREGSAPPAASSRSVAEKRFLPSRP